MIFIDDQKLYKVNDACWNVPSTCVRNTHNLRIKKKGNYNFYINEKNNNILVSIVITYFKKKNF